MGAWDRWLGRVGLVRRAAHQRQVASLSRRAYAAAQVNRLTAGWKTSVLSADAATRTSLKNLRARSRELYRDNDYAKRYITMVVTNMIGPNGIVLQNKAKDPNGTLDTKANQAIEDYFTRWGKKGVCEVTGQLSWLGCQRLFAETVARDGELLIRRLRGYPNDFGYAIQLLEADHLDEELNQARSPNGNHIRMGVELDRWRRPVAYHLLVEHPGDATYGFGGRLYERVPADQIIHAFVMERPEQTRGVPWMHACMLTMENTGGFEEAAIVSARAGACKMGILKTETGDEFVGDDTDAEGNVVMDMAAGEIKQIPKGWDFVGFDPKYPDAAAAPFIKHFLRRMSTGLNVAYHSLSGDLEGVNFTSSRTGDLDQRSNWRVLQGWASESVHQTVFEDVLDMGLTLGTINGLPRSRFDKFNAAKWQGRGWPMVNPRDDMNAIVTGVEQGIKTRGQVLGEEGLDIEDVFAALEEEAKMAKEHGLSFPATVKPAPGAQPKEEQVNA